MQKRTPRVPISYSNKRNEWKNHASGNKSLKKSEFHVSSDEVAHGATLALAEASQRGGTSTTSMPCKIKENLKSSYEVRGRMEFQYSLKFPSVTLLFASSVMPNVIIVYAISTHTLLSCSLEIVGNS